MKVTHVRQKVILSALAGAIMIPGSVIRAKAADEKTDNTLPVPIAGIESVLTECLETNVKDNIDLYLVPTSEGEYLNRAFSNVSDFTYIRSAPDEESEWTGKLYSDSTVDVLEYNGEWTKIRSGNVEGYVPADVLYTGEKAEEHAKEYETDVLTVLADVLNVRSGQGTENEILTQVMFRQQYEATGEPVNGWYPVKVGDFDGWVCGDYVEAETTFSYAESKEEEEERIAREEAESQVQADGAESQDNITSSAQQNVTNGTEIQNENGLQTQADGAAEAQEAAALQPQGYSGQAVIDFACQFIGNPYVWGGTSLTNGADCSGFVQSVYANFGISLPRTTWDMENVGYAVSFDQALPGDLVLYDGHVGLYMGDGNIVNAMNEAQGIGICNANYAPIITIRRVL